MTLRSQGGGHGVNDLEWVGVRHLYLNFDDPRLSVLFSVYLRFFTSFFCMVRKSLCAHSMENVVQQSLLLQLSVGK